MTTPTRRALLLHALRDRRGVIPPFVRVRSPVGSAGHGVLEALYREPSVLVPGCLVGRARVGVAGFREVEELVMESGEQTGFVKWWNASKGIGFVFHPRGTPDVFVHYSQIRGQQGLRNLSEGDRVAFTLDIGPRGAQALDVRRVEG